MVLVGFPSGSSIHFYPGIDFIRFSEGQDFFIEGFDRGGV